MKLRLEGNCPTCGNKVIYTIHNIEIGNHKVIIYLYCTSCWNMKEVHTSPTKWWKFTTTEGELEVLND